MLAFALLSLLGHAVFAGATHHHGGKAVKHATAGIDLAAENGGDPSGSPASGESNCPSCHLQRTFSSVIRSQSLAFELSPQSLNRESLFSEPCSRSASITLSSRAPPLA